MPVVSPAIQVISAAGTHKFRLRALDDEGATAYDTVTVVVNTNPPPTANAGIDVFLKLPTDTVTLRGVGTDDGFVASYKWTKVSGPTQFIIGNSQAATTLISGLVDGVYVFRLTVTDNGGLATTDDIMITVYPEAQPSVIRLPGRHKVIPR